MADTTATQQAILASARRHFMEHGFKSASLNRIVADAGFTKGAFYGYYASKEELFDALVVQTSEGLAQVMGNITAGWTSYPEGERAEHLDEAFFAQLPELADFIVGHRDDLRLILARSEGTRYEGFLESLVENNAQRIEPMLARMGLGGMDSDTYRLLMTAYYGTLARIATGDYTRGQVVAKMRDVQVVFQTGILALAQRRQGAQGQERS